VFAVVLSACVDLSRPSLIAPNQDAGSSDARDSAADKPIDLVPDLGPDLDAAPDGQADTGEDASEDAGDGGNDGGLALGAGCSTGPECATGLCIDNVCCATRCQGVCVACNVAGAEGRCSPVAAGEDPAGECAMDPVATCGQDGTCDGAGACGRYRVGTQCQPASCVNGIETPASTCDATGACASQPARACPGGGSCQAGSCSTACADNRACQTGFFCEAGLCRPQYAAGQACTDNAQCTTGYCVDRVCCGTPCTEQCFGCNLVGFEGTCKAVPAGQDPFDDCAADASNVCGNDGVCNGSGQCRKPSGASCGTSSCAAGIEKPAGSCNGAGTCTPAMERDCGAYVCGAATCMTSCGTEAHCAPGFTCSGNTCVALPGPVLHWKLDEASGLTALDASGNGFHGAYRGTVGIPTPSSVVPPLLFANPFSRAFTRASRHAVQLTAMPAELRPTTEVTLSVWYRSTLASGSAELVSGGNSYALRLWASPPRIEFFKRANDNQHYQCWLPTDKAIDGAWHHAAGVITGNDLRIFFDGGFAVACVAQNTILYGSAPDLWVGRHGGGTNSSYDFEGNIDEVRVYTRALPLAEIARLASGRP
jgi:Concanavalin A-like lectin/glucanases superfamily